MDLMMGAVGVRGVAREAPADGGLELTVTSDAMAVRTTSEQITGLAGAEADVTRLRLGLEGAWRSVASDDGGHFTPTGEVGLRHDAGDAETGFGVDVGAGVMWSHAPSGLSGEVRARALLSHEADGLGEKGIAGTLRFDPDATSERGFSMTLTQTMGAQASGGMDTLLGRDTLEDFGANADEGLGNRQLSLEAGYGFGVLGNRFTATPNAGLGLSEGQREYRVGWRLGLDAGTPVSVELGLDATRREPSDAAGDPDNAVMLRGALRW